MKREREQRREPLGDATRVRGLLALATVTKWCWGGAE
jgi:hypothetical protein